MHGERYSKYAIVKKTSVKPSNTEGSLIYCQALVSVLKKGLGLGWIFRPEMQRGGVHI